MSEGEKAVFKTIGAIAALVIVFMMGMFVEKTSTQNHIFYCEKNRVEPPKCIDMLWPGWGEAVKRRLADGL
jgi:hypothetical protein